jgi:hypothetical protein
MVVQVKTEDVNSERQNEEKRSPSLFVHFSLAGWMGCGLHAVHADVRARSGSTDTSSLA